MLTADIERYVSLRRALGFKLVGVARNLRSYGRFAASLNETHIRSTTAVDWAARGPSPYARHIRLRDVVRLARFLVAEDQRHQLPAIATFPATNARPAPYIYTPEEIVRLLASASRLRATYPLRRSTYQTLLGLIACTGLRVSEALDLRLGDILADGALRIRRTKFGKSRLVPLHPTAHDALRRYLSARRARGLADDHVFLSAGKKRIASSTVNHTFRRMLKLAEIAPSRARRPRIHDLRHSFATRALERCSTERSSVSRHFVALSTYLGHVDIKQTYWYLESTAELMSGMSTAAEALARGGGR
jgi:integrase/recombinase XerD